MMPKPGLIRIRCLAGVILALLFAIGCTRYVYEIDLTPKGNQIERTLLASQNGPQHQADNEIRPLPEEVLRLEEVYQQPSFNVGNKVQITGTFAEEMPQDIGGAGSYTHWETSLGSASFYVERFRGETDLAQHVQHRLTVAGLAVDMLNVFVDAEATDSPAGRRLRQFVGGELRRDAKSLTLLIWALQAVHDETGEPDKRDATWVRLFQFLVERNYMAWDDVPRLLRGGSEIDDQWDKSIIRKLELTEKELIEALPSLSNQDDFEKAFHTALIHSDVYQQALSVLPEGAVLNPDDPTGPGQVFLELIMAAIGSPLMAHDELSVRLHPPVPPFSTNGNVSEDGPVEWKSELAIPENPSQHALPSLCFAAWTEPDHEFQTARFGKVLLTGRPLGEYVLWRRALDEQEGCEWDAFIASLTPDDDLRARLSAFRFSALPADAESDPLAAKPLQLLTNPDADNTSP